MLGKLTGGWDWGSTGGNNDLQWGARTPRGCLFLKYHEPSHLEVLNTAPAALKLHKGTQTGQFTPRKYIVHEPEEEAVAATEEYDISQVLTAPQYQALRDLPKEYSQLFT